MNTNSRTPTVIQAMPLTGKSYYVRVHAVNFSRVTFNTSELLELHFVTLHARTSGRVVG
jgi:hypothetical protein